MTKDTIQDDLAFIKKIVEESRKNVCAIGSHLIVWGILVSIGLVVSWFLALYNISGTVEWVHWGLVIAGGWLFEIIYGLKVESNKSIVTYSDKVGGFLWFSIGITMSMIGFLGVFTGTIDKQLLSPLFSTILAVGYFTTGIVYDVKWIRNLAFGWWGGAIIMFIFPGLYHLVLMAAMMIAFQTIPGFIIRKTWKE